MCTMKAVVDPEGQVVLPRSVLEAAGLKPGGEVEISVRDGTIAVEPARVPRRLIMKGRVTAIVAEVPVPPVTVEMVNQMLDSMRREREGLD